MLSLLSFFVVLASSLLIIRIATVALVLTGLPKDSAQFQARSAFTGAGFTTSESERVVNHPLRRRIAMSLMLLGSLGVAGVMASLILTFAGSADLSQGGLRLLFLLSGLLLLWQLANTAWFDRWLSRWIDYGLKKWTTVDTRDYASMLHLSGDYTIAELRVEPADWMANRSLADLGLRNEGILILGILRASGEYEGAPKGSSVIGPRDTLIVYGNSKVIHDLDQRRAATG